MSLISDTDYLIHQLRLSYLRDVEDLYGPRIISLDQSYQANPYILASGLADHERWPELAVPSSPQLSEDETTENASGFPGARLKYTQTIMGGKSGGMGLRVHGKRMSTSKRMSYLVRQKTAHHEPPSTNTASLGTTAATTATTIVPSAMKSAIGVLHGAPSQETLSASAPPVAGSLLKPSTAVNGTDTWVKVDQDADGKDSKGVNAANAGPVGAAGLSPGPNVHIHLATAPEEAPVTKVVQFVPKFSKEMEARRQMRMAARRGPIPAPPPTSKKLSFDTSSEEEEDGGADDNDDSEDEAEEELEDNSDSLSEVFGEDGGDSIDEGDVFDPEFAATRTGIASDSASDVNSIMSGNGSMPESASAHHHYRGARQRLSPVTEGHHKQRATSRTRPTELNLAPAPKSDSDIAQSTKRSAGAAMARSKSDNPSSAGTSTPRHAASSSISTGSELVFVRKKLAPAKPHKSALSSMLALSSGSSNPFSELYAAISGRGQSSSTTIHVFFPHATRPAGKAMELIIRKDATVEEVIGFALWSYCEEDWQPKLDEGLGEEDAKRDQRLSAVGWILRIAEHDGEPDDDFPPLDRMGKVAKFGSDAYAIQEATPSQVQQNEILESKIQRRPSRTMNNSKKPTEKLHVPTTTTGTITSTIPHSAPGSFFSVNALGSLPLSTSLGPSSSHGPQIFLRIRVADDVHISTTIPVSAGMYMQEALEMVCRRRKLANPKDWALVLKLPETTIMVPLDRTVASLQGNRELFLFKRSMLNTLGLNVSKEIRTTDPNASIFKHMSDTTPEQQYSSVLDYTAAYKKYTIYRKMPMLVTRQERTLAIDGVYIHIMPSTNKAKAVFDHGKTSSYHIKSIADCQQSRGSSAFKLVLNRASGNKRYDFEAESPKLAAEIVAMIKNLKTALERSGTVNRSRRSRQVV